MSGQIGNVERACFRALVDVLLPGDGNYPPGNGVGVSDRGLDRALQLRPDLRGEFLSALRRVQGLPPGDALDLLEAENGEEWLVLRLFALWAYYDSPELQQITGYAGQPSMPFEVPDVPDFIETGLLAPVLARAPMWRPAG